MNNTRELEIDIIELEDRFDMSADLWSVTVTPNCGCGCGNHCCGSPAIT